MTRQDELITAIVERAGHGSVWTPRAGALHAYHRVGEDYSASVTVFDAFWQWTAFHGPTSITPASTRRLHASTLDAMRHAEQAIAAHRAVQQASLSDGEIRRDGVDAATE